jgi:hypothetical protein
MEGSAGPEAAHAGHFAGTGHTVAHRTDPAVALHVLSGCGANRFHGSSLPGGYPVVLNSSLMVLNPIGANGPRVDRK